MQTLTKILLLLTAVVFYSNCQPTEEAQKTEQDNEGISIYEEQSIIESEQHKIRVPIKMEQYIIDLPISSLTKFDKEERKELIKNNVAITKGRKYLNIIFKFHKYEEREYTIKIYRSGRIAAVVDYNRSVDCGEAYKFELFEFSESGWKVKSHINFDIATEDFYSEKIPELIEKFDFIQLKYNFIYDDHLLRITLETKGNEECFNELFSGSFVDGDYEKYMNLFENRDFEEFQFKWADPKFIMYKSKKKVKVLESEKEDKTINFEAFKIDILDKFIDQKWVETDSEFNTEYGDAEPLFTIDAEGYYYLWGNIICRYDKEMEVFSILCDEDIGMGECYSLHNYSENTIAIFSWHMCARVNDNATVYYKLKK